MQQNTKTLDIVVPVYNEGATVVRVYQQLRRVLGEQFDWMVYFIYDFPADLTVPYLLQLQQADSRVIPQQQNSSGVINALRYGFKLCRDGAIAVVMGDDSDDLETLPLMYAKFAEGAVVVASSRYSPGGNYCGGNWLKKWLSKCAGFVLSICGIGTKDPTNNYKLYSAKFLKSIDIESSGGFEVALELTVKAAVQNLPIAEVPGRWKERDNGNSKFKMLRWLPHYLKWFFYYLRNKSY